MAAAADSCIFPSPHSNHNRGPRPSYTVRDKPQWLLLSYRRVMSLTRDDALGNDIGDGCRTDSRSERISEAVGSYGIPGCHSGKCDNQFEHPA